jgi:uncharacterized small protein (DUF1192 family)
MPLIDDEPVKKPTVHTVGEDLSRLSVDELNERIELLRAEIARLEVAVAEKLASRNSADTFFRR